MYVREALEESQLEKINIENLQQGKDSAGDDMPAYRNPDYANFKTKVNPRNRGFWDLRLHGEYYKGIQAVISRNSASVFFKQTVNNEKIEWLHERLDYKGSIISLGITEDQIYEVQVKNKPKIRQRIQNVLSGR